MFILHSEVVDKKNSRATLEKDQVIQRDWLSNEQTYGWTQESVKVVSRLMIGFTYFKIGKDNLYCYHKYLLYAAGVQEKLCFFQEFLLFCQLSLASQALGCYW